ncbi:hypothetical protein [Salinibacter altiplanensis]|uniref:hypothetical protein n=1 Tax=Salinibacter altiplanensis TaxID=1803181 RepID=UPI001F27B9EA|nr:hypothetical protein [Salinibacter altiplanensis]
MSSAEARASDPPRSPDQVWFFTQYYHQLKGLCYAPAGGLLLLGVLGGLLVRPQMLIYGAPLGAFALLVLTSPWVWYMHRRYESTYGRVRNREGPGSPLGTPNVFSAWTFVPLLTGAFCWIALITFYIPQHTPLGDNHFLVFFPGWLLIVASLPAPLPRLRWTYATTGALLFLAPLLPLITTNMVLVQAVNYGLLGAVLLGVGLYNHRLLVSALGPIHDTREVSGDE